MAAILTDCDPKAIYATVNKEPRDSGSGAGSGVRMRPPGDLKLARSLSKSDSDLLVSPPSEEEGGLGNRSESVSNCSTGKKRLEKSPSFTSEWDEVSVLSHTVSDKKKKNIPHISVFGRVELDHDLRPNSCKLISQSFLIIIIIMFSSWSHLLMFEFEYIKRWKNASVNNKT